MIWSCHRLRSRGRDESNGFSQLNGVIAEICFWAAAGLLAYTYALYPALARIVAERCKAAVPALPVPPTPEVAVVIAAYNEEKHIGDRIRNLLDQDYPAQRLTVMVGSDGSTDGTVRVATAAGGDRVTIVNFGQNRGKASVLNDLVGRATQEVVVFSDANTRFERDTVRQLVAGFADPGVGAVCGELLLAPSADSRNEDHRYWSLERRLKAAESAFGGLLGANGGVYAIRRSLFRPLAPDTICDDFVIVMNVAVAGSRVRYEPRALAHEETPDDMQSEFRRRVRIGIGNYQSLFRHPAFLTRTRWARRWAYVSHKVLRWLTPHLLALMLVASFMAASRPPYALLFAAQLAAYAGTGLVYATARTVAWPPAIRGVALFFVLNAAFAVAFVRFLRGNYSGGWRRTAR